MWKCIFLRWSKTASCRFPAKKCKWQTWAKNKFLAVRRRWADYLVLQGIYSVQKKLLTECCSGSVTSSQHPLCLEIVVSGRFLLRLSRIKRSRLQGGYKITFWGISIPIKKTPQILEEKKLLLPAYFYKKKLLFRAFFFIRKLPYWRWFQVYFRLIYAPVCLI